MTDFLYRYVDRRVALPSNEWGDATGSKPDVVLREHYIIRRTAKGAWIDNGYLGKRFVLFSARKQFACQTVEEAKESFLARKRRQLSILKAQQRHVEDAMALVKGEYPLYTPIFA
jgi:hypothetical protein